MSPGIAVTNLNRCDREILENLCSTLPLFCRVDVPLNGATCAVRMEKMNRAAHAGAGDICRWIHTRSPRSHATINTASGRTTKNRPSVTQTKRDSAISSNRLCHVGARRAAMYRRHSSSAIRP